MTSLEAAVYLLVDRLNHRPLARHENYRAVAALAYIQFANIDTSIIRCGSDAQYSPLPAKELRAIAASMGVELPGKSWKELVGPVRQLVETAGYLLLPFDVDQLNAQACAIEPDDARPYGFDPDSEDTPELLGRWHCEPSRNRPRWECQHWIHFTTKPHQAQNERQLSGTPWNPGTGGATMPPRATCASQANHGENDMAAKKNAPAKPAKKTPAPAKAATAKADKPAKAPKVKAERIEQNGVKRPKAGTVGDQIWSTADSISAKKKSPATFEEVSNALDAAINEASLRAGFQRWRKFNGLKGRTPKAE